MRSLPSPQLCVSPSGGCRALDWVDPRARVLAAGLFSVEVAFAQDFLALGAAMGASIVGAACCGATWGELLKKMTPVNLFMLSLLAILPWTFAGPPLFTLGGGAYSAEGLKLAAAIALKGNAVVLALLALLGSLSVSNLGHALSHLHVPDKLTHLLLFTVRYLSVLRREHLRLAEAMRLRGFHPRMNLHTYRSYGHLIGMLLVHGLDRSERVMTAMKCRGFRGHFYLLDHFAYSRVDARFALVVAAVLGLVACLEWL